MKIKFKYLSLICFLLSIGLSGCYEDENITSELGIDNLSPQDSSEPLDHFIYEFYTTYNTHLKYEYDTISYRWNLDAFREDLTLIKQEDKAVLLEGMQYIDDVFFSFYSEEFKTAHLPATILLADSINIPGYYGEENKASDFGTAFLAIGRIHEGVELISDEDFNDAKNSINYDFWLGHLQANEKFVVPASFYKPSEGFYNVNLAALSENEDNDSIDPRDYGFWSDKYGRQHTGSSYYWAPKEDLDIAHFFERIFSNSKEEMELLMDGYPKLQDKYNALVNNIKEEYGFDIQSIGEANK